MDKWRDLLLIAISIVLLVSLLLIFKSYIPSVNVRDGSDKEVLQGEIVRELGSGMLPQFGLYVRLVGLASSKMSGASNQLLSRSNN